MPKIKPGHKGIRQSIIAPYFLKRSDKPHVDLHEFIAMGCTVPVSTTYPAPWTDPDILSQTNAYRLTWACKFPSLMESAIKSHQLVNVYTSFEKECVLMSTFESIYIYRYKIKPAVEYQVSQLTLNHMDSPPKVHLIGSKGILAIGQSGRILYWNDYTSPSLYVDYQTTLSQHELITAVTPVQERQAIMGTSCGNIYLIDYQQQHKINVYSFYKQASLVSYLSDILPFTSKSLKCLSNVSKSSILCSGEIVSIAANNSLIYAAYPDHIIIWEVDQESKVKLLSVISIHQHIKDALARHIPTYISKHSLKSSLHDLHVIENGHLAILVSYSVPEMNNYVQYAVILLAIDRETLREDYARLTIQHTASVPYSVIPGTLSRLPSLELGQSLAFVTFDQTVVAVSLDKQSVFEEYAVLKQKDDMVLCTKACQREHVESAIIITKGGTILFEVDVDKIREPAISGNIYATAVDDINERDTLIFKSRLEQFIFYGIREDSFLKFPLRAEHEDVTKAVLAVADEIMQGSELLPKSLDLGFYLEARYVFSSRIIAALITNGLIESVPESERLKLMLNTEYYYFAVQLYETFVSDGSFVKQFSQATQLLLQQDSNDLVRAFLIDYPLNLNQLLDQFFCTFDALVPDSEDTAFYLLKLAEVILSLVHRATGYEQRCLNLYDIKSHGDLWMVSAREIMMNVNERIRSYASGHYDNVNEETIVKLKDRLYDISVLLLKYMFNSINKSKGDIRQQRQRAFQNTMRVTIERLCSCGLFEAAVKLAETYDDLPSIISALENSQLTADEVQAKHTYFSKVYGYDYLNLLVDWLIEHHQEEKILSLSRAVPEYLDQIFENRAMSISWIHHMTQENYEKASQCLKECVKKETNVYKRCDMLSWMKMLYAVEEQDSPREITAELEFAHMQTEMIDTFNEHLKYMHNERDDKVEFLLNRCATMMSSQEMDELRESIRSLLNHESIERIQVIKLLVKLDNVGADISNILAAIQLANCYSYDDEHEEMLKIIWNENREGAS
ncbi:hypothetical protein RMATCC62417_04509 [Rhizopus microsporus]|nr:hypothetical protein RMATCC62417_04509 [Rhizopus microsporus]